MSKELGLSITEIQKRNLCRNCDPVICNNDYQLCPYQYDENIMKLCVVCKDIDNETIDGQMKCFKTCKYKTNSQKQMDRWFS